MFLAINRNVYIKEDNIEEALKIDIFQVYLTLPDTLKDPDSNQHCFHTIKGLKNTVLVFLRPLSILTQIHAPP